MVQTQKAIVIGFHRNPNPNLHPSPQTLNTPTLNRKLQVQLQDPKPWTQGENPYGSLNKTTEPETLDPLDPRCEATGWMPAARTWHT